MTSRLTTPLIVVGVPDADADVRYICGFNACDPIACAIYGDKRWLVVPAMERARAERALKDQGDVRIWTPNTLGLARSERYSLAAWVTAIVRQCGWTRVRVGTLFPTSIYQALRRRRIQVIVETQPLIPRRQVKTQAELRCLRESQRVAVIAMRSAQALIGSARINPQGLLQLDGALLTSEIVQRRIAQILLAHRCFCADTIVAGGTAGACPHERGSGPLRAHYPIVIDIFPKHLDHGYWGDITRTVVRGHPAPEHRRMYAAVRAAHRAALAVVRPGVRASTVHQTVREVFRKWQFETRIDGDQPEGFIHGTGHGLGLAVHEDPRVATNRETLKPGHVITIEPGLYYREFGGVRIEDAIVVTTDGWRYLAPCEKRFEIG